MSDDRANGGERPADEVEAPKPVRDVEAEIRAAASARIEQRARRHVEAQSRPRRSVWFGLGMFGLVGWAVALPTLAGLALGSWLDRTTGSERSWTLTLLAAGVGLGCLHAWFWIQREMQHT